jgi:hypothetical protein
LQLVLMQEGAKGGCKKQEAEVQEELCNHPGAVGVQYISWTCAAVAAAGCAGSLVQTGTATAESSLPDGYALCCFMLQETVVLWEQLRPKQTTKEEKEQLVATILKKVRVFGVCSTCQGLLVFCGEYG